MVKEVKDVKEVREKQGAVHEHRALFFCLP